MGMATWPHACLIRHPLHFLPRRRAASIGAPSPSFTPSSLARSSLDRAMTNVALADDTGGRGTRGLRTSDTRRFSARDIPPPTSSLAASARAEQ